MLGVLRGSGTKLVLDIKPGGALDNEQVVRLTERQGAVLDVIVGPRSLGVNGIITDVPELTREPLSAN